MDDQFQVLFSTNDYLAMQSRCHDLQLQNKKLIDQNKDMSDRLFDMAQKNDDLIKKMRVVEENNKYLSQEGIKMAQLILQQSNNKAQQLQTWDVLIQTDEQVCQKCQQLQKEVQSLNQKTLDKEKQRLKQKQQLQKQVIEQSIHCNNWNTQRQLLKNQSLLLKKQKDDINQINKKLETKISIIQKQSQMMKSKYNHLYKQNQLLCTNMKGVIDQLKDVKSKKSESSTEIQLFKFQMNEMKLNETLLQKKLKQSQNTVAEYIDLVKGQNIEIVKLQKLVSQKDSLLMFHEQTFREHQAVIKKYEDQLAQLKKSQSSSKLPVKNSNTKNQQNTMVQIKELLDEYFTNLIIRLMEMGGVRKGQIMETMRSQQRAVKKYIEDVVTQLIPKE